MNQWIKGMVVCVVVCGSCRSGATQAEYAGEDLSGKFSIRRDKETKAASMQVDVDGDWRLYAGPTVEEINFSTPIVEGNQKGTYPLKVSDTIRSYFQVVTPNGRAILAESHLPMAGGYNFRDLGGIKTTDGRHVKWGKILRSDDLHHLTEADLTYLASIPLVSIVDFRSQEEIESAPDRVPATATDYAYSIMPGNLTSVMETNDFTPAHLDTLMMEMNRLLVTDPGAIERYRTFFALLQDEGKVPLMFHCSAGKDRTGMGAALVLFSLGVDEATILQNYLESNAYVADKYDALVAQNPALKSLFQVKPEFIGAGLEQIRKDHGNVERYLTDILGVDLQKMRKMYLD